MRSSAPAYLPFASGANPLAIGAPHPQIVQIEKEILRCDLEIAEIEARTDCCPAYLKVWGIEDWRHERRILTAMKNRMGGQS